MRWLSPAVAVATVVGVGVMGFVPTSAGLSNRVGALECRAVLAPIDAAFLSDTPTDQQRGVRQAWFVANGYIDDPGQLASDEREAAAAVQIRALCDEARHTRSVWMILTAVFGVAVAFATRRGPLPTTENPENAHG